MRVHAYDGRTCTAYVANRRNGRGHGWMRERSTRIEREVQPKGGGSRTKRKRGWSLDGTWTISRWERQKNRRNENERKDTWGHADHPRKNVVLKASAAEDGGTTEEDDEGSFAPLESSTSWGPPAVLCVGFSRKEVYQVRHVMEEAGDVRVIGCTEVDVRLEQALNSADEDGDRLKDDSHLDTGIGRTVVLSGLDGEEMAMAIETYFEANLPQTAFAAAVPNTLNKSVRDVASSVWEDHRRMSQER